METRSKIGLALGAVLGVGGLVLGGQMAIGSYDVGVTAPHSPPVQRVLRSAMVTSVRTHARGVVKPDGVNLQDPSFAARGFGHYSAACRTCHGGPGVKADPWMVIYPPAPELARPEVTDAWTDEELFWILKNGIKDTGMMALGPTHQDADIWAVTALVRQLPRMSPQRYRDLASQARAEQADTMGSAPDAHQHHH